MMEGTCSGETCTRKLTGLDTKEQRTAVAAVSDDFESVVAMR